MRNTTEIPTDQEINLIEQIWNITSKYKSNIIQPKILGDDDIIRCASFVFNLFRHLIPTDINQYLLKTKKTKKFRDDLIYHLIRNAILTQTNTKPSYIFKNNKNFIEYFDALLPESTGRDFINIKKSLDGTLGEYLNILSSTPSNNEIEDTITSCEFPVNFYPFTYFMAFNYDFHRQMINNKIKNIELIDKTLTSFRDDILRQDISSMPSNNISEDINKFKSELNETDKYNEFVLVNSLLFEKEYNFSLIFEISKFMKNKYISCLSEKIKSDIIQTLSILSLCPNVIGKKELINFIIYSPLESAVLKESKSLLPKKDNGTLNGIYNKTRLSSVSNAYLQLYLIAIPVMEKYFLYLIQHDLIKVTNPNIKFNLPESRKVDIKTFNAINGYIQTTKKNSSNLDLFNLLSERIDPQKKKIQTKKALRLLL